MYKRFMQRYSPYNPVTYWRDAGRVIMTDRLSEQAENIVRHITELDFRSVFELGVGEGRITEPILRTKTIDCYDSCDMTPDRHTVLTRKLADYPQFNTELIPFEQIQIRRKYDLVLAVECLMHVTPKDLPEVMRKMADCSAKYVVNVDAVWSAAIGSKWAKHNFPHDYERIYNSLGFSCRKIELPYQQMVFVADTTQSNRG